MRTVTKLLGTALVLLGGAALAGPNDLVLRGLGNPNPAATPEAQPGRPADYYAVPGANADFRVLARELGAALSATNLMPAETVGHVAFAASLELSVVSLDTRPGKGFRLPTEADAGGATGLPGPLLVPSVHVRKGLPFSLELGGRVGWVDKSRMFTATGEVKWALLEGFAYLPDVSVRGYVTHLFNARDLTLVTGGLDVGVGKQFAIGGMATLTPYGGFNPGFTGASSRLVDFNPTRAGSDPSRPTMVLEESGAFREVQFLENGHQRFYGGLRFISGVVQLGAEMSFTTLPGFTQDGQERSPPPQLAFNTLFGLDF